MSILCALTPAYAGQLTFLDTTIHGKTYSAIEFTQDGKVLTTSAQNWEKIGVILKPGETGQLSSEALGITCKINETKMTAQCEGPASRFPVRSLDTYQRTSPPLSPKATGVLLGYDLATSWANGDWQWSSSQDLRVMTPWGHLETSGQYNHTLQGNSYKRGFTTWTTDWPNHRLVFQAGDIYSSSLGLAPAVMMGGIRLASDPSLDPMSPTFPIPVIGGVAVADSKIQAFLNAAPVGSLGQVGRGAFQIQRPFGGSGYNKLNLVLTDKFGRETTITNSFYLTPQLLRPGLSKWDLNIGKVRDWANGYQEMALAGSYMRGLSDHFTVASQIQASREGHNLTLGLMAGGMWGLAQLDGGISSNGGRWWSWSWDYQTQNWRALLQIVGGDKLIIPFC